ncbi:unnamed protein product [Dibothriocephalus latus]|uniref:Uncharacterized protein n=1 Tax=Dibothriocephalus latus TaxID=60516 RepID=A0A3P7RLJ8_DIBLA|nr:unnamed protein product [Dibothriocephalus latus]
MESTFLYLSAVGWCRLSRRIHQQKGTSVLPLIQISFEKAKKLGEEKQITDEVTFAENPSLNVAKLFSRTVKAKSKGQLPILQGALINPIFDAELTADSFNAFLSRTFNENSVAALPTIRPWTGAALETKVLPSGT